LQSWTTRWEAATLMLRTGAATTKYRDPDLPEVPWVARPRESERRKAGARCAVNTTCGGWLFASSQVPRLHHCPHADFVDVSQQVGRVLINAVSAGPLQFVLAVAAR
jgi:hypothetical protein